MIVECSCHNSKVFTNYVVAFLLEQELKCALAVQMMSQITHCQL